MTTELHPASNYDLRAAIPPGGRLEVLETGPTFARRANHGAASRFLGAGPNLSGSLALPIIIVEGPAGPWATSKLHFERHFELSSPSAPVRGWKTYRRISSLFVRRSAGETVILPHGAMVPVPAGGYVLTDRSGMSWPLSGVALREAYRPLSWAARLGFPDLERVRCIICPNPANSVRQTDEIIPLSVRKISPLAIVPASFALCIAHARSGPKDIWTQASTRWHSGTLVSFTLSDGRTVLVGK